MTLLRRTLRFFAIPFMIAGLSISAAAAWAQSPEAPAPQAEIPPGFTRDGDVFVHAASGFRFPAHVAGFTRLNERGSDPSGEYVAIGYERALGPDDAIIVRIAVVHLIGMTAADHYKIMKPVAMSHFSAVSVLSESAFTVPG